MLDRDRLYLAHMLDTAEKSVDKTREIGREDFDRDENLRLALVHLVQVIGEAARRVSQECREAHPEIPWREIIGMRSKIVHDYMNVDEDLVWQVATDDLPALLETLLKILKPEPGVIPHAEKPS